MFFKLIKWFYYFCREKKKIDDKNFGVCLEVSNYICFLIFLFRKLVIWIRWFLNFLFSRKSFFVSKILYRSLVNDIVLFFMFGYVVFLIFMILWIRVGKFFGLIIGDFLGVSDFVFEFIYVE